MIRKSIAALVIAAGLPGIAATSASASGYDVPRNSESYRIERADRVSFPNRVAYFERLPNGRAYVEMSNGATWDLRPCRYEDSRTCYWDARTRGNGAGKSFVDMRGHLTFVRDIPRH